MMTEAKQRSSEIIAQGDKLKNETIEAAKLQAKVEADRILAGAKAEIEQEISVRARRCATRSPTLRSPAHRRS
jgi:F0F1-type ATP synthase membrane subunit b/b'